MALEYKKKRGKRWVRGEGIQTLKKGDVFRFDEDTIYVAKEDPREEGPDDWRIKVERIE